MLKKLYLGNEFIGNVGEETGVTRLKVGDVIIVTNESGYSSTSFVCKYGEKYGVMGWGYKELKSINQEYDIRKVMSGQLVTTEILNDVRSSDMFVVKEIMPVEMTLEEIEDKLGHPIKLV
jgi:thiamine monophosphate kinase